MQQQEVPPIFKPFIITYYAPGKHSVVPYNQARTELDGMSFPIEGGPQSKEAFCQALLEEVYTSDTVNDLKSRMEQSRGGEKVSYVVLFNHLPDLLTRMMMEREIGQQKVAVAPLLVSEEISGPAPALPAEEQEDFGAALRAPSSVSREEEVKVEEQRRDFSEKCLCWASLSEETLDGFDLHGSNLSGQDLRDANLKNTNLSGANFSGALLAGADFEGANLEGANFEGVNLSQVKNLEKAQNLNKAILKKANLRGVNLAGTDEKPVTLEGANLEGANLTGAKLPKNLKRANLKGAILAGVDLKDVDLEGVNLEGVDLTKVQNLGKAKNLNKAILKKANLSNVDLSGVETLERANLEGADLTNARLPANLRDANLRGANLTGVDLRHVDFTGADLTGANLTDANLTGNLTLKDVKSLAGARLQGAHLEQAHLANLDLEAVDLTNSHLDEQTDLGGTTLVGCAFEFLPLYAGQSTQQQAIDTFSHVMGGYAESLSHAASGLGRVTSLFHPKAKKSVRLARIITKCLDELKQSIKQEALEAAQKREEKKAEIRRKLDTEPIREGGETEAAFQARRTQWERTAQYRQEAKKAEKKKSVVRPISKEMPVLITHLLQEVQDNVGEAGLQMLMKEGHPFFERIKFLALCGGGFELKKDASTAEREKAVSDALQHLVVQMGKAPRVVGHAAEQSMGLSARGEQLSKRIKKASMESPAEAEEGMAAAGPGRRHVSKS